MQGSSDHCHTVGEAALNFEAGEVMELGSTEPVIVILVGTLVKTYDGENT